MGSVEQLDPVEESVLKSEAPKQQKKSMSTDKFDFSAEAATDCDEQQTPANETASGLEAPKDMETYSFEECGSLVIEHPALDSVLGPMRENEEALDGSDFARQCCLVINSPVRSGDALVDECVLSGESCRVENEYRAAAISCLESDPEYEKLSEVECGLNQIFLNEIDLKDEAYVSNLKPVAFSRLASQGHSVPITATGVKEGGMFPPCNNINLSVEGIKESTMDLNDATKTLDFGKCDTKSISLPNNSTECCKNTGSGDVEAPLLETNSENTEKDHYLFADQCFPRQSIVYSAGHAYALERSTLFPNHSSKSASNSVEQIDSLQCCNTEMVVGSGSTSDMVREETCKSNGILQGNNSAALADISFFNERSWSAHIGDAEAMESNEALSSLRRSARETKFEKASNRKKAINKAEDLLSAAVRRKRRCLKRSVRISSWGLTESLLKYIKLNAGAVKHRLGIVKSGGKSRKSIKVHVDASSHGPSSKSRKHASPGQVSLKLKLVRKGKNATESDPLIGTNLQEKLSIGNDDKQQDLSKAIKDSADKDLEDALMLGLLDKKVHRHFNSSTSPDSEAIRVLNSQPADKAMDVHHNSTQASLDDRPPAIPKMRKKKEKKEKICQLGDSDAQNKLLCSSIKTEIQEKCGDNGAKSIIDARLGILCESADSLNSAKLLPSAEANGNRKSKGLKSKEKTTVKSKPVSATTLKSGNSRKVKGDKWKLMGKYSVSENGVSGFTHEKEDDQEAAGKHVMEESGNEATITMRKSAYEGVASMPAVPASAVQQISLPRTAWVCCDDCVKWRCIPANLADVIDETNCRWTCKDNQDKAFADCSIPQEKSNAEINADLNISGEEDGSGTHLSGKCSTKQSAVPQQSSWMLIKSNIFLHRSRNSQTLDEIMICHCKFSSDGKLGCGDECLNRMLNIECVHGTCPCGDLCSNQQFQRQNYANLKWFRSGKKGYGLQVLEDIAEGKFLIEYVGEVLDLPAYEARQRVYASKGHKHFYFMTLNGNEVIDACAKGNLGRFINHSCDPNCRTEKWMVNGEVCIGLFAVRDIKKGEELTFDYNYVRVFGAAAKKCYCGTSQCRGYIGGDRLDNEAVVQSDSDEEFPEPVVLYENGEVADVKALMSESSSLDVIKEKKDKIILQTNAEILSDGKDVTNKLGDILTSVGGQLHSSEEDSSMFGSENADKTRLNIQQESPSNRIIASMTSPARSDSPSLETSLNKPVGAEYNRSAIEIIGEKATQSNVRPRMKISRPFESGKSKELTERGSGATIDKDTVTSKISQGTPNKLKKLVESPAKHHLETVEDKLNELLDDVGGICKRKDASKGYLKLLVLTAASGDRNHHEAIQSNRDLSMILDAILKTKSRMVLTDIVNKNGLQMLHSMVKKCRGNFNMIPILRKLLKVFEFLAERMILNLEHINGGPPRPGVESFRDSILSLTEHEDWKVHQTARKFRDKWIPRPLKKFNCVERASNGSHQHRSDHAPSESPYGMKQSLPPSHLNDTDMLEGPSHMFDPNTRGERKRKSRWDQSPEATSPHFKKDEEMPDAPPGFSCVIPFSEQYPGPLKCPSQIPLGNAQERFNSCLPIAYGIPFSHVQQFGTPQASTVDHWVIAPGMPFRPFPPLPLSPRKGQRTTPSPFNGCLTAAKHTDQTFPGSSTTSPFPPVSTTNSHQQQYKGPFHAQRRPFQQRRNGFRRPPWGFSRYRNGPGQNFPRRPPGAAMGTTVSDRNEHPVNANNFMG